jgi:radical SAM protein with 4Fe4S-binding SPASM domain
VIGSLDALHAFASRKATPLSMHLELTYRCNATCAHCLQDRHGAPDELGLADWLRVLEQGRELGMLFVTLSGGEAMLSPHFWGVFEAARRLGYAVRIFTNGLRLDRATVKRIAALAPFAVEVSIFSLDPAKHDAALGVPGSLRRTIRGLFLLKRAGVHAILKCPLLAGTGGDHAGVKRLADRLGASVMFDPAIFTAMDGDPAPTRCRGDDDVLVSYFAYAETRAYDGPKPQLPGGNAPCGMGRTFLVVGPDGTIRPCVALQHSAGNVRLQSLQEVWRTSPLMLGMRGRTVGALPICGDCPRNGYCGRCSALALLEDGDLDGPSSRACQVGELRERAWGLPPPANAPVPARKSLRVLR